MNKIKLVFTSPKVTLWLFTVLLLILIPSTFLQEYLSLLLLPVKIVLALIALNLSVCTLHRLKTLKRSTLVIHLGVLAILAGGLISTFGYIATVNMYEGSTIDKVFRWDIRQDVSLGFDLHVARINYAFYPVPVKVGVLKDGKQAGLFLTSTEDSFVFEKYRVKLLSFISEKNELQLAIEGMDGKPVGSMMTSGQKDLPSDFPLDFKLVAFRDPAVKRLWVDLELKKNDEVFFAGVSEVNNPLQWHGMQFSLTQAATDKFGHGFAGIQISKDPGRPLVYGGFVVFLAGILMVLKRWMTT